MVRPAHRLGDCAGRSPGLRVATFVQPSQFPSGRRGRRLAAHSCGGSHGNGTSVAPTRVPSCLPGVDPGEPARCKHSAIDNPASSSGDAVGTRRARKTAGCCPAATEYDRHHWHSGPACGPRGHRTPAAVTQAGYAYCQLRDTPTVSIKPAWARTPEKWSPQAGGHLISWTENRSRDRSRIAPATRSCPWQGTPGGLTLAEARRAARQPCRGKHPGATTHASAARSVSAISQCR